MPGLMKIQCTAEAILAKWFERVAQSQMLFHNVFDVVCVTPEGRIRWHDTARNMVCTAALDNLLNVYFGGGTPLAGTAYTYRSLGLIDGAAFSALNAGDTLAAHPGWAEATYYSNTNRPTWTPAASSAGANSIVNPSTSNFNINANTKIVNGLFLVWGLAASVPGASGTDLLFSTASFSGGSQNCNSGDTLKATFTVSIATG
jgi:hypothetical protein